MKFDVVKDLYSPEDTGTDIQGGLVKKFNKPKKERKAKAEKSVKLKSMSLRAKFFTIAGVGTIAISLLVWGVVTLMSKTNEFFETRYLARHNIVEMQFSWPITIEDKEPEIVYLPVNTALKGEGKKLTQEEKREIIRKSDYAKIVSGIWMLESNQGQNTNDTAHHNDCEKVGMSNEFGYRALDNFCFASFEESVAIVTKYVDENLKSMSATNLLCYYSSGRAEDTCEYAKNFNALDEAGKLALK